MRSLKLKKTAFVRLFSLLVFTALFCGCASQRYLYFGAASSPSAPDKTERNTQDNTAVRASAQDKAAIKQSRTNANAPDKTARNMPAANGNSAKHELHGEASWYGPGYHGRTTANGERFNQNAMTAAHRTLPFNTRVRVTDLQTGKSVVVRINDRGPYAKERIIDLSMGAAQELGMKEKGHAQVRLDLLR